MDEKSPIAPRLPLYRRVFQGSLWHHRDFLKLWSGQSISLVGSQVTKLALPTVAIQLLAAGPLQVGIVNALSASAFPVLGLFAGVWADRLARRRILVVSDVVRLLALGSVPVAFAAGVLSLGQLYAVAAITGVGAVFFDVAYLAYVPILVERAELVQANARLEMGRSTAEVAGPGLAGALIQAVQAAPAILVDALSYAASVLTLVAISRKTPPAVRRPGAARWTFLSEMREGVAVVAGHPTLRLIAACTAMSNLSSSMVSAVFLLFAYEDLRLSPGAVGVVFAVGGVGALLGALVAHPVTRTLGIGPALVLAVVASSLNPILVSAAVLGQAVPLLALSRFVSSVGVTVYNVDQVSLRQAIVPPGMQGRMNATIRTLASGIIPVGSVIGGILGLAVGLVPTILAGGGVAVLSLGWLLAGPARLRGQPVDEPS